MRYVIPDEVYDVLKWLCVLVLPAAATLVGTVGTVWGMSAELSNAIVTTIVAVATFGGAIIGLSAATASESDSVATDDATDVAMSQDDISTEAIAAEAEAMGKGEE